MISADLFRAIVAETNDDVVTLMRLPLDGWEPIRGFPAYTTRSSYDAVAAAFNLDVRGPRADTEIREHLYHLSDCAIAGEKDAEWRELKALQRQLIYDACLDGAEFHWPLDILQLLLDGARRRAKEASHRGPWLGWEIACQRARDAHQLLRNGIQDEASLRRLYRRDFAVAAAAERWRARGLPVRPRDGEILDAELSESASEHVDALVVALGGRSVLRSLFMNMAPTFDAAMGRHHLVRRTNPLGDGTTPSLPVGYLLKLAVKHISREAAAGASTERCFAAATDLTALYDVQPYNFFETMFRNGDGLIALLRELALYDSNFALVQLRPADIVPVLRGLLTFATASYGGGWRVAEAIRIVDAVVRGHNAGPFVVSPQAIAERSGCSTEITNAVLRDLTHTEAPYASVLTPHDLAEPDFLARPLVEIGDGELLLIDAAHCGWSFYEAILSHIRAVSRRADQDVGGTFEAFVHQQLASHGVVCRRGLYTSSLGDGEVDAAIETESQVIFIEMKKKVLRRIVSVLSFSEGPPITF